jgi:perosamine synthetase
MILEPGAVERSADLASRPFLPVYQPDLSGREREYVLRCLDSSWISSKGEFIGRFESEFARFIGAANATSVCNGTAALHLALAALDIGPGDEVIVPTLTYVASVNMILQTGATPVFVDAAAADWQLNVLEIERHLSPRTRAVMAVHLYGAACPMAPIVELCRAHGIFLVEDCAEAIGTRYHGQHVGTFGDLATFSFFGNKTLTTGEGGMVIARNSDLLERAYHLKTQGVDREREYWHDTLAYNYRMTNICAAIGLGQLDRVEEILIRKRHIAMRYARELADLPLVFQSELAGTRHGFWMCSIALKEASLRDPLRSFLRQRKVETRPVFFPAHCLPHCARFARGEEYPVAEAISAGGICLPSYPALSDGDVQRITADIREFFA